MFLLKQILFIIGCLALIYLPQGCSAQTPKRPELSSFTAEFTILGAGQEMNVQFYESVEEKKQLQIIPLGSPDSDIKTYTWEVVGKNSTIEYDTVKPFGFCIGQKHETPDNDPGFANLWYWLKKASYNGTKTFNGQKVDAWSYENKKEPLYFEVGVLPTNPNEPVYYFSTEAVGVVAFNKYTNSPPPLSVFDIPTYCKIVPESGETQRSQVHSQRYKNVFRSKRLY